jgi:GNAT superfamily N-acetyltransferase
MSLLVELVETPTDDARALIEALEAELSGSYTADQRHGYGVARVFQPNVLFFVARLDGEAVGCGGVAFENGLAEIKRMYVRPDKRGARIGQAVLARLEDAARARGVDRLALETGDVLHPAIRLYERCGFTRCAAFGAYVGMPPQAVERSVFMEKRLGAEAVGQMAAPPGP